LRFKQRHPADSLDAITSEPDGAAPSPSAVSTPAESPQESAERQELGAAIQHGLAGLPPDQRVTLVLADIEGFSYEQVAEATGTNVGTVKSRLSRARAAMRDFLTSQEELLPSRYRLKSG
jgi:RNA polymerase sigma-70 factor (ECF subfamily)